MPDKKKDDPLEPFRVRIGDEELYVAPAGVSDARASTLLPSEPTADMRHLLGDLGLPPRRDEEQRDYLPNEAIEWVLDIRFVGEPHLRAKDVEAAFRTDWQQKYGGGTLHGYDPDKKHWTFAVCADGPKTMTHLKLALPYYPSWEENPRLPTVGDLGRREAAAGSDAAKLGRATVTPNVPAGEVVQRAKRLRTLKKNLDVSITLALVAPRGRRFDGRQVWDVMLCLGLRWGDMDCFHWDNPSDTGDSSFFSVQTSTPPGYFLPEEIAANRVHVEDLVFGYSVPRCPKPLEVFEAMVRALAYCQERLGGKIVTPDERALDVNECRRFIRGVSRELTDAGFPPGSENALRLF